MNMRCKYRSFGHMQFFLLLLFWHLGAQSSLSFLPWMQRYSITGCFAGRTFIAIVESLTCTDASLPTQGPSSGTEGLYTVLTDHPCTEFRTPATRSVHYHCITNTQNHYRFYHKYSHIQTSANSADTDQNTASDQGLQCLPCIQQYFKGIIINCHIWANSVDPDKTPQNAGSALFASHPAIFRHTSGNKMDF